MNMQVALVVPNQNNEQEVIASYHMAAPPVPGSMFTIYQCGSDPEELYKVLSVHYYAHGIEDEVDYVAVLVARVR